MGRRVVQLSESKLKKMISESVKNILREFDEPFPYDYKDARERDAYFQRAVKADFPQNATYKTGKSWEDTYNALRNKQAEDEKVKQKAEKDAFKQKKAGSLNKAFRWALEGDENDIPGYNEYLSMWPVVFRTKSGRSKVGEVEVSDLTEGGYGGILDINGHKYSVDMHCDVYLDPFSKKIGVDLEDITGKDVDSGEEFPSGAVDIERTREAIRRAFVKKVKENIQYILNN